MVTPDAGGQAGLRVVGAIVARDEERHLGPCLESLAWTSSQLVLLDARTTDRSKEIAERHGAEVVIRQFESFPIQRNTVLELVQSKNRGDWLIFLDADERVTNPLAEEVVHCIQDTRPDAPSAYWIPRLNFIWGGWIRHGGWSPDEQLRLLRVGRAVYDEERDVHELVRLAGAAGHLREPMIHYNYDGFRQFIRKQRQYAALDARRLQREGVKTRPWSFLLQPTREFRRRYLELGGYRDGWRGLALASLLGWYTAATYLHLARLRRHGG